MPGAPALLYFPGGYLPPGDEEHEGEEGEEHIVPPIEPEDAAGLQAHQGHILTLQGSYGYDSQNDAAGGGIIQEAGQIEDLSGGVFTSISSILMNMLLFIRAGEVAADQILQTRCPVLDVEEDCRWLLAVDPL